jgi:pimeloyl-ACP methyl ester carboxylesterase
LIHRPSFALLHGGGHGSWVWDETVAALKALGAHAIALDVPGCGLKRDRETIELGVDDVADELLADIASRGFSDVVLVGHSQAGTLLPVLWRRRPTQFRKLIYLSCCAPLPGQSVIDMMGRGLHGENPEEVGWPLDPDTYGSDAQRPLMFCNDMEAGYAKNFLACLDKDQWPIGVTHATHWDYEGLNSASSTYILCEQDGILPPSWQLCFAGRLHCDHIVRIGAGHQAMNTQPDALAAILLAEAI